VPELPEVQAHAERLTARYAGAELRAFRPLTFTALKTASPDPADAAGRRLVSVERRGKYLLADLDGFTFVVHLMQGGRLKEDPKPSAKPRNGIARWTFTDGRGWLLTEAGTERRAGVWCTPTEGRLERPPLDGLGPEALDIGPDELLARFHHRNQRLHGFLRDQSCVAGLGRRLANEVCHRARLSPFAMTGKLRDADAAAVVRAIHDACEEGLGYERGRDDMSSSADRPGQVHHRPGEACPVCGDVVREVSYSSYVVDYCPTCQTGGKVLADNTTSRFLK
jgi:formamidopyrimidine-DNA glycosylase